MTLYASMILKPGKEQSLQRFHPWVFSGAIQKIDGEVDDGDIVRVADHRDRFLGYGFYQKGSIAARLFSFEDIPPTASYWTANLARAFAYRQAIGLAGSPSTNVFRLVNAEGDYIPSLVADFYNGTLVLQLHSLGVYKLLPLLVESFRDVLGSSLKAIYNKSESTLPVRSTVKKENGFLAGNEENASIEVLENGLKFRVDVAGGQKTGFFIDQRENRALLANFAKGKSVLNLFGYTGGFSMYAIQGGAKQVDTVDSSAPALDIAVQNAILNFGTAAPHQVHNTDAFEYFSDVDGKYDLMILDPPAFAKHNEALHQALKGYQRLNALAISAIRPGGIIFTFSCSQVVSRLHFRQAVFGAAAQSKRRVRILHQLSQPPDHPIDLAHPEGEYLKGLVLYVE